MARISSVHRRHGARRHRAVQAVIVALVASLPLTAGAAHRVTRRQIAQLEHQQRVAAEQLAALMQRAERLSNRYDAAVGVAQELKKSITVTTHRVNVLTAQVAETKATLVTDSVHAYVLGQQASGPASAFSGDALASADRRTYEITAAGDLSAEVTAYTSSRDQLATSLVSLDQQHTQALQNAAAIHNLGIQNQQAAAAAESILHTVSAHLRHALAVQAEQIAQAQAAAAAKAAGGSNLGSTGGGYTSVGGSSIPAGAGGDALKAAESQLGVPYVWGGETPNQGFDCSGLTQWAWGTAGVSIPRVAAAQWEALPHVSVHNLEPGDLLFYYNLDGDFQVDHVVMYAGIIGGVPTVIQAPHTGATVSYSPVWLGGLIGAARP